VTDVTSVKAPICREARRLGLAGFVGGHPMAGSEGRGFAAASSRLFRGRPWVLSADAASRAALRRVRALVRDVGARPVLLDPRTHDRAVAFLSHVPQIVAWALMKAARGDRVAARHLAIAGPAFREMTRLANSPQEIWREILDQNQREVIRALRALRRALAPAPARAAGWYHRSAAASPRRQRSSPL
jgi:prephenate dehydrogenase